MDGRKSLPVSPAPLASPIVAWQTPWSNQSRRELHASVDNSDGRQGSLKRGQRRALRHQQSRQKSLELLEAQALNRMNELQHREDKEVVAELSKGHAELRRANASLRKELEETKDALEQVCRKVGRLSALVTTEKTRRRDAERELQHCRLALASSERRSNPRNMSKSMDSPLYTSRGSTDGTDRRSSSCSIAEISPVAEPKAHPVAAGVTGDRGGADPLLPDVLDCVQKSQRGTVSRWITGMQAACSPGLRQALVLPWLLHKLFYLSTELIDEKRQEFLDIFVRAGSEEAAMRRHLSHHYRTAFPLSGHSLQTAIHKVMAALAHSMIDSEEWNPNAKDADAVQAALAASGLEKIVEEYLHIAVGCWLRSYSFTDDLGEMQRFDSDRHFDPIDGETAGEWCIVVFPAFVVLGGGGEEEEGQVVGKRFVLNSQGK